ncbi:MAG: flavin-dependent alkanal monooxygenase, partial [Hyphomicrobiales bacterium]|nr:flavin-dependent alkanal monooxygenase [Hyphomicrobiales bacterium]
DTLSRGRLIAGFVRGIGTEYHATGMNPAFSHERYLEAHDLITQAWTREGPFNFEGRHFNYRYVNLWPRPYMKIRKALGSRPRTHDIDGLIESGTVIAGTPRTVRDKINRVRDETGVNNLVAMLQFGVMSDELALRNMEMFASEVMPHLR